MKNFVRFLVIHSFWLWLSRIMKLPSIKSLFQGFINLFAGFCLVALFCLPLHAEQNASNNQAQEKPRFAAGYDTKWFFDVDVKDARAALDMWMKELGEEINIRAETTLYENTELLVKDFQKGKLDFMFISPSNYLRIMKYIDAEIAFTGERKGKKTHKYLLLVNSHSGFHDLEDLKGKNLAIAKGEDIGLLFLNTLLLRNKKQEANLYFQNILEMRKSSQAVHALFFGQTDACIVPDEVFNTMIEHNPQVGKDLVILSSSREIISGGINFFRKDYDEKLKKFLRNYAYNIGDKTRGRQVLMLFKVDRLVPLKVSDLDSLKDLLHEYERLKGKK